MLRLISKLILLSSSLAVLPALADQVVTTTVQDTAAGSSPVVVERHVIVTETPAPKETVATPSGYASCFTVDAGWSGSVWIPSHKVCQYENMPNGVAWVEGYWACTTSKSDTGECTGWDWRAGRWEKTVVLY